MNLYAYGHANPLTYSDPSGTECPTESDVNQTAVKDEFFKAVEQRKAQWESGDRGERFRTGGYTGPPRAHYTKPMAIDAAKRGDFEAAELYENYMCPSCHVPAKYGHSPSDAEFNLKVYVEGYRSRYRTGQGLVLSAAVPGGLAVMLPRTAAVVGAWSTGTSIGQAVTGRSVGAIDPMNVLMGSQEIGTRLSTTERVLSGVSAGMGALGIAGARRPPLTTGGGGGGSPPSPPGGGGGGGGGGGSRIVSPVFRMPGSRGHDFLVVETSPGGPRQGFYRSSGERSGMPDRWLPFDEVNEYDLVYGRGWVNKGEYMRGRGDPLHRFGSEEFRNISDALTAMDISPSTHVLWNEAHVNDMLDFFGARTTSNNVFRPTPRAAGRR